MNSYQKRKQEIEYYKQRCKNLEEAIREAIHLSDYTNSDVNVKEVLYKELSKKP